LVTKMEGYFKGFTLEYIERSKKIEADEQAKATAHSTPLLPDVFFQVVLDASIKTVEVESRLINVIQGEDWQAPIMAYPHHYYEPDNATEHNKMQ
jgi:hypothetical protein